MQSQRLIFFIFMLIAFPIIILFTNHNLFFIVVALVLFLTSAIKLNKTLQSSSNSHSEIEGEPNKEFEDLINIDFKTFGKGIKLVKNLIIILFFIYSIFYFDSLLLKVLTSIVILYRISDIIGRFSDNDYYSFQNLFSDKKIFVLIINILSILIIMVTVYNKFLRKII
jgi:hypothetical protein